MPLDQKVDQDTDYPFSQRLAEKAMQDEVAVLVQFAFFRPHLAELLRACADAGLGLLVLKGAALAETVYARPTLRRFGDLDVLVRRADAPRARTVMESLGYIVDPLQWEDLNGGRDGQANFFKHIARGSVVVEMHTELINNDLFFGQIRVDDNELWERALSVRLAGAEAWVLGPEDQILHLCLHLAGHYLAAPQSLRDIAQVLSVSRLDWTLFVRLAQKAGAATICFAGLFAASRLLGTSVPPSVLDSLAPDASRLRLEQIVEARVADSIEDVRASRTERLRLPLLWYLLGSSRARLRAGWHILFPSRSWLVAHYYFGGLNAPEVPPRTRWTPSYPHLTPWNAAHFALTSLSLHGTHLAALLRRCAASLSQSGERASSRVGRPKR